MPKLIFRNHGELDINVITTFGVSVKQGPNPIGYFGTGLKFAIATLLRHGATLSLRTAGADFEFHTKEKVIRGETFQSIWMNDLELPYTTNLGRDWQPWMAIREIFSNCRDESGGLIDRVLDTGTSFIIEGVDIDLSKYFLWVREDEPIYEDDGIAIYEGESPHIFYKGFAALDLGKKPATHTYNLKCNMKLTEDRTLKEPWYAEYLINKAVLRCSNEAVLKAAATAPDHFETKFDSYNPETMREADIEFVERALGPSHSTVQNAQLQSVMKRQRERAFVQKTSVKTPVDAIIHNVRVAMKSVGLNIDRRDIVIADSPPDGLTETIVLTSDCKDFTSIAEKVLHQTLAIEGMQAVDQLLTLMERNAAAREARGAAQ